MQSKDAGASAQSASGQRDADCREYYVVKERGDSDNIAAVQAILSDVVCGVVGVGGAVVMASRASQVNAFFQRQRLDPA